MVTKRRTSAEQGSTNRKSNKWKHFQDWMFCFHVLDLISSPAESGPAAAGILVFSSENIQQTQSQIMTRQESLWLIKSHRGSQLILDQGISSINKEELDPNQNSIYINLPALLIDAPSLLPWQHLCDLLSAAENPDFFPFSLYSEPKISQPNSLDPNESLVPDFMGSVCSRNWIFRSFFDL